MFLLVWLMLFCIRQIIPFWSTSPSSATGWLLYHGIY